MVDKGKRVEAVGYMRTSSAANVGDGKDSEARQRKAIECYRLSQRTAYRAAIAIRLTPVRGFFSNLPEIGNIAA